jgi:hypothetical protein
MLSRCGVQILITILMFEFFFKYIIFLNNVDYGDLSHNPYSNWKLIPQKLIIEDFFFKLYFLGIEISSPHGPRLGAYSDSNHPNMMTKF